MGVATGQPGLGMPKRWRQPIRLLGLRTPVNLAPIKPARNLILFEDTPSTDSRSAKNVVKTAILVETRGFCRFGKIAQEGQAGLQGAGFGAANGQSV